MNLIVAVGGTGQMVAHYYVQLYLLNLVRAPFRLVVIDTDEAIGSLQRWADFLDLVGSSEEAGGAVSSLASIKAIRVQAVYAAQVAKSLTAHELDEMPASHPARAFFSTDELAQRTDMGLYARPALSAVLGFEQVLRRQPQELRVEDKSRIVLVGSLIGGTGAGLIPPLLSQLANAVQAREGVSIRAVLFGDYFQPTAGVIADDEKRFRSNKTLAAKALEQSAPSALHSFAFIEEPRMPSRDPAAEKRGADLPWPARDDPYWQGVCTLQHLLTETTRDAAAEFFDRDVNANRIEVPYDAAWQTLRDRLGVVQAICDKQVVRRMVAEPFCSKAWGEAFCGFVAGYLERAAKHQRQRGSASEFCAGVQRRATELWNGTPNSLGLRRFFPDVAIAEASPAAIRRTDWPSVSGQLDPVDFENPDRAHKIAASALLFRALKGGRQ